MYNNLNTNMYGFKPYQTMQQSRPNSTSVSPLYTVTSLQEVQIAQPNFDGSPMFFYIASDNTIVCKQMDMNGLIVLKTFKEMPVEKEKTVEELIDEKLKPINEQLALLLVGKKEETNTNVSNANDKPNANDDGISTTGTKQDANVTANGSGTAEHYAKYSAIF